MLCLATALQARKYAFKCHRKTEGGKVGEGTGHGGGGGGGGGCMSRGLFLERALACVMAMLWWSCHMCVRLAVNRARHTLAPGRNLPSTFCAVPGFGVPCECNCLQPPLRNVCDGR